MNTPQWPRSRFVRGRARGGGAYRPYFYFRRNGRTIPAGGDPDEAGAALVGPGRRRGGRRGGSSRGNTAGPAPLFTEATFLRAEHYAFPEDGGLDVKIITVDSPVQCPGWRLYFPNEPYKEETEMVKRIKVLEAHYTNNPVLYDLAEIQSNSHFCLKASNVHEDLAIKAIWPNILQDFQTRPQRALGIFGVAMHSVVTMAAIDASLSQKKSVQDTYMPRFSRPKKIYVRPVGFIGVQALAEVSNAVVDNLYCLRGAVTSVGALKTTASWIAYKCPRCGQEQALRQSDQYGSHPNSCKRDGCLASKGFVEERSSPYTRLTPKQIVRVMESNLPALRDCEEENSEFLDVELRYDLVDSVAPGHDVVITGILKMRLQGEAQDCQRQQRFDRSSTSQFYLKACSIVDTKQVESSYNERDMVAIAMINNEPDSFKLLVNSLAPELHGNEMVKAGVLLSLFGGAGSQLHDDSEINVLIVGDPGIEKAHLMQMCAATSEKGTLITGKGGPAPRGILKASIQGSARMPLVDAGALITSINGHCAIDDIDRLASHQGTLLQAMQSQTIALPYCSLFASFATSTAIIATSNSIRAHYDQSKTLCENVRIGPALLRHFHLALVLTDKPHRKKDISLTEHVRALHAGSKKSSTISERFAIKPKTNNSMIVLGDAEETVEDYDLSARLCMDATNDKELELLPPVLMRKFIAYARQKVKPLLTKEAADAIKSFYMELRAQQQEGKSCAASTSQLEGLIRLAQARARVDFASEASMLHVRDALCIVRHCRADTTVGDYIDTDPAKTSTLSQASLAKRFVKMLQMRTSACGRRSFDFDELKDMARHAGIMCGVTNLIDIVNLQGYLLKKGPNLYEVLGD